MDEVNNYGYLDDIKTLNVLLESTKLLQFTHRQMSFVQQLLLRKLTDQRTRKLYEGDFCKYCFRPWNDGAFSLKVRPKPVLGKRIRKLLRKQQEAPRKLTLFEQKLLNFCKKKQGNKLVLTCLSCQKSTIKQMSKCEHNSDKKQEKKEEEESTTKIKKKKKKDIFVGLNPEVVLKTALMNKNSSEESSNINFKASQKINNYSKTYNLPSLNDHKNLNIQVSNLKSNISQFDNNHFFNPNDLQKEENVSCSNNSNNNNSSRSGSFFNKLDYKRRLEKQKERELRQKMYDMRRNIEVKKMLGVPMEKKSKKDKRKKIPEGKKPDLKNFLRAFGNLTK